MRLHLVDGVALKSILDMDWQQLVSDMESSRSERLGLLQTRNWVVI